MATINGLGWLINILIAKIWILDKKYDREIGFTAKTAYVSVPR